MGFEGVRVCHNGAMFAAASALVFFGCLHAPPTLEGIKFRGVHYVHRHSKGNLHEFTPKDQPNLEKWTDMLTINDYPTITTGEALAKGANGVLDAYKGAGGVIVRTHSVPRTALKEAEHLIVALFVRPEFAEAAFSRIMMVNGRGLSIVYSRRAYGKAQGKSLSEHLSKNGQEIEKNLMALKDLPKR